MSTDADDDASILSPTEAFAVLGNETRMEILRTLWSADEPLSFSELRDLVGMSDSGQFNYHLDQVEGHFVRTTDDGYELRNAGEQVIRAVLAGAIAGAITGSVTFEPTVLDAQCPYCGGPTEAWYEDETFTARCKRCSGILEDEAYPRGTFMHYSIPPAGVLDRTPDAVYT
ncbi:MAG: helix-turn-helix domain-containing protein, partial [Actinobacteria bacterium]|nr:helix-turn-helix domain-containing protein [Actinomycetota bacterium]NIU65988.1 helix-turn-helix domain-containing protein [Actinomycetota bacterium]NIW27781.1 helix-turn-helix domain-containing protein [Actinomycetota bacterium]NIX20294.1 helix-turn-helix domain-containing protein [Actinomycetota bacterium]